MKVSQKLEKEIIKRSISLFNEIIGKNATAMVINKSVIDESMSLKEILAKISEIIQDIYGLHGSYSIMRELGRELAAEISKYESSDVDHFVDFLVRVVDLSEHISIEKDMISVCKCRYYNEIIQPAGLLPTEHAVCWIEIGLIEGIAKRKFNDIVGVRWVKRDEEKEKCVFEPIGETDL